MATKTKVVYQKQARKWHLASHLVKRKRNQSQMLTVSSYSYRLFQTILLWRVLKALIKGSLPKKLSLVRKSMSQNQQHSQEREKVIFYLGAIGNLWLNGGKIPSRTLMLRIFSPLMRIAKNLKTQILQRKNRVKMKIQPAKQEKLILLIIRVKMVINQVAQRVFLNPMKKKRKWIILYLNSKY